MVARKVSASFVILLPAMLAVVGCALNRSAELRNDQLMTRIGGAGQLVEPKRSLLTVIHLSRPLRDPVINDVLWRSADEQAIGPEIRRTLQSNGLRIGLITGELPLAIDTIIKAPPPHKVDPAQFLLADGDNSLVALCPPVAEANILLNLEGGPSGKDFKDAQGFFRVTSNQEGTDRVAIRLVPEIHHGPSQSSYGAVPNASNLLPQELTVKNGQKEETLRDLAATINLKPNQIAVIGGYASRPRSLGSFLFTQTEPNSDRVLQTVFLIWAKQSQTGKAPNLVPVDPPPAT